MHVTRRWPLTYFAVYTLFTTSVQLLHYILKCNYFVKIAVSFFFWLIISIPDEELFSEIYVGYTTSYFV